MVELEFASVASALGPLEGLGFVFFLALAIIFLWQALIVLSVLAAALSSQRRTRARTMHL